MLSQSEPQFLLLQKVSMQINEHLCVNDRSEPGSLRETRWCPGRLHNLQEVPQPGVSPPLPASSRREGWKVGPKRGRKSPAPKVTQPE